MSMKRKLGKHDIGKYDLGKHDLGEHDLGKHDLGKFSLSKLSKRLRSALTRALPCALVLLVASPAAAWDPSTTHLGIVDAAVRESAIHLRWMAASELTRGLFTPLRVDPSRLQPSERRLLLQALRRASESSGALPLGGPGTCPGMEAPPITRRYCVDGDLWEQSALSWLSLGVLAELVPSAREIHHFVDRKDPTALTWSDLELPRWLLRSRLARHNGAPLAGVINRTNFDGHGPSAIAWLSDEHDLLAPPRLREHLERAYLSPEPGERAHHLALALVCVGATLHVLQDLTVPAHARGDVSAFFAALSGEAGDRGLPLQEIAKNRYGRRDLPHRPDPQAVAKARGHTLASSLEAHILGGDGYEGIARFTAGRFLSESSVPPPMFLEDDLDAGAAAAKLLADAGLDPVELAGARLAPWPAQSGYVVSGAGRPLAAFDSDEDGRIRAYIDAIVYQDQMEALLPRAVEVTRSALDLLFPGWPAMTVDRKARRVDLELGDAIIEPVLLVMHQDPKGKRTLQRKVTLRPKERNRVDDLPATEGAERVVLVLRGRQRGGDPILWEYVIAADAAAIAVVPAPYVAPPIEASPAEDDDDSLLLLGDDEGGLLPPTGGLLPMEDDESEEDPEPEDEANPPPGEPGKKEPGAKTKSPAKTPAPETKKDPSKSAPPKTDPPKTDPPKTDPPKTDPPKTDPPKTDPPKTDPPKTDPPKSAPPKTDPAKGSDPKPPTIDPPKSPAPKRP